MAVLGVHEEDGIFAKTPGTFPKIKNYSKLAQKNEVFTPLLNSIFKILWWKIRICQREHRTKNSAHLVKVHNTKFFEFQI